jgi:hypothetical protein
VRVCELSGWRTARVEAILERLFLCHNYVSRTFEQCLLLLKIQTTHSIIIDQLPLLSYIMLNELGGSSSVSQPTDIPVAAVADASIDAVADKGKRILTRDDKKRLVYRRAQLCSELMQISSILQEDAFVACYDFDTQNVTHKSANSGEMLMLLKELFDKDKPNPALLLAQDIHGGKRGFFTQFDKHIAADPGYTVRRVDGREDLVREIVSMYKSLYGRSPSMVDNMDLKHKSLSELEKMLKNYHKGVFCLF